MEITDIKMTVVGEERLKAYVRLTFDDCFVIDDVKIIQGDEGLFVSFPSKMKNGQFKDICHPLNRDTRKWMEEEIFTSYREKLDGCQR